MARPPTLRSARTGTGWSRQRRERDRDAIRRFFETGEYPYQRKLARRPYERQKAALQVELLKVQDWVKATNQKIVVLFEGRDAAGKGRDHQAVHRAPQPARRPGGRAGKADRRRADRVVLPALHPPPAAGRRNRAVRPFLVQPRRRRAGHGVLRRQGLPGVHAAGARAGADARAQRDPTHQVLVLGDPGGAAPPLRGPRAGRAEAVEAVADRPPVPQQVGRIHGGQGGDVLLHGHRRRPLDDRQVGLQEARAAELHAALPGRAALHEQGRARRRASRIRSSSPAPT